MIVPSAKKIPQKQPGRMGLQWQLSTLFDPLGRRFFRYGIPPQPNAILQ
jgi:hypothetical protein